MSSSPSNDFIDTMQPLPTHPSVPSGVCSPSPNPPSWCSSIPGNTPTPPGALNQAAFGPSPSDYRLPAPPSVPSGALSPAPNHPPSQAIHLLNTDCNPNISGTSPPQPSRLDRGSCVQNCAKFYVVTCGWEVGIFDNWAIARTRVESVSNNCHLSFSSWEMAVGYYTRCFNANVVKITTPLWLLTPTPAGRRANGTAAAGNSLLARLPASLPSPPPAFQPQQPASQTQPPPATPLAITVAPRDSTPAPHGIGTQSRPFTVSPSTPVPADMKPRSRTRIRKGKKKATGTVVVVSSDSEDAVKPSPVRPAVAQPSEPSAPVPFSRRRRILIIDDDDEEIIPSDGCKPAKRVRHFRMALHTMPLQEREDSSPTVPLPVKLFNVAVTPCEAGVAGPSGTASLPVAGPSLNLPPETPDIDYEVSDIQPELLAALCKRFYVG